MAEVKFGLGIVNIPTYLLLNVIKVSAPNIIEQNMSFGPNPTSINIAVFNLSNDNYYFDFRVSPDGIDQGVLVSRFLINAATNQILMEWRYYTAGGPLPEDPTVGSSTITDSYFTGKNVTAVFKEGFRFLVPVTEWDQPTPDVINFIANGRFGLDEVITVLITYKSSVTPVTASQLFRNIINVTNNVTMDSTFNDARINLLGINDILTVTLPPVSSIPDKTTFYFVSRGGKSIQPKIITQGSDKIFYDGFAIVDLLDEIWCAKGEYIWMQVNNGIFEVIQASPTIMQVGEKVIPSHLNHTSILLANMAKFDGAYYPRIYWYILNCLPANFKFSTSLVNSSDATYKAALISGGIRGQFGIDTTPGSKIFRMPWLEGMTERALNDLSNFSGSRPADSEGRTVNLPGGFQPFMVGPHNITLPYASRIGGVEYGVTDGTHPGTVHDQTYSHGGTNNILDNTGVLYGYRI